MCRVRLKVTRTPYEPVATSPGLWASVPRFWAGLMPAQPRRAEAQPDGAPARALCAPRPGHTKGDHVGRLRSGSAKSLMAQGATLGTFTSLLSTKPARTAGPTVFAAEGGVLQPN